MKVDAAFQGRTKNGQVIRIWAARVRVMIEVAVTAVRKGTQIMLKAPPSRARDTTLQRKRVVWSGEPQAQPHAADPRVVLTLTKLDHGSGTCLSLSMRRRWSAPSTPSITDI